VIPGAGDASGEAGLLDAARSGDAEALEALLRRHEPRLYRFARRLCRNPADAEDVLQESLLAAARGIGGFRGASSLSTWLYTIARSHCIKKHRRRTPSEISLEADEAQGARERPDAAPDPEATLETRRLRHALERAIARLDRPYREVLILRDVEGLTAPEVATVTGLSVAAVKSRLHRARARVREELAPLIGPRGAPTPLVPDRPCPDVVRLLSRHLEGDISSRTCARMERHLAACSRCRASCDALRTVLAACRSSPYPEIPPALQERVRAAIRGLVAPVESPPA
jgi:RNA polymerase sigma-70 factor (ECF subfamily)